MFECGEVLDEVLKAVDLGKKSLRLDYTPYRLYDLRKKKTQVPNPVDEEEEPEEDPDELEYKREAVENFMSRHEGYLEQQKSQMAEKEEMRKREERKQTLKKKKVVDEYKMLAEVTAAEVE